MYCVTAGYCFDRSQKSLSQDTPSLWLSLLLEHDTGTMLRPQFAIVFPICKEIITVHIRLVVVVRVRNYLGGFMVLGRVVYRS